MSGEVAAARIWHGESREKKYGKSGYYMKMTHLERLCVYQELPNVSYTSHGSISVHVKYQQRKEQYTYFQFAVDNITPKVSLRNIKSQDRCFTDDDVVTVAVCPTCCSLKALSRVLVSVTLRGKERRGPLYDSGTVICSYLYCLSSSVTGSTAGSSS